MDILTQSQAWVNGTLAGLTGNSAAAAAAAATSKAPYASLYAGLDVANLSLVERAWKSWFEYFGPTVGAGLMAFVVHEIVYFGRALPWVIIDSMPSMRKYKLQDDRAPTPKQQWECTKYVLLTHFTVEIPQIWGFAPLCEFFQLQTWQLPLPSYTKMLYQIAIFFVFEDAFHYWAHRGLHWGPLYKHIHKKHHEFSAPFGLAAEYAHPLEVLILGMGTVGGPLLYCALTKDMHMFTVLTWIVLRLFQAIDAHSGYDLPISMHNWIPFWAGADHHDHHHQAFVGCYSTSFRWWDSFMGTDRAYKRHRARQADERAKAKAQGLEWPVKPVTKTATGQALKPKVQ